MKLEDVNEILNRSNWFSIEDYNVDYGLRREGEYSQIDKMIYDSGKLLIAHRQSCFDEVILEVYREHNLENLSKLEKPIGECIALNPQTRFELALYLLSTIQPIGK